MSRIEGVRVHIDHILVGIAAYLEFTDPITFRDIDMFGREILINGSASYLQLSEVEVHGADDKGRLLFYSLYVFFNYD